MWPYYLDIFQLGCGSPADQSEDNPWIGSSGQYRIWDPDNVSECQWGTGLTNESVTMSYREGGSAQVRRWEGSSVQSGEMWK